MSAIISFSIGSPQSFISQARRTQDLYQGSLILSYLASKAVEVAESATAQLLYPPADQKESIPNQLVIRYNGDPSHAQQHAEAIQTAVKSAWEKISKHTYDLRQEKATFFVSFNWQQINRMQDRMEEKTYHRLGVREKEEKKRTK